MKLHCVFRWCFQEQSGPSLCQAQDRTVGSLKKQKSHQFESRGYQRTQIHESWSDWWLYKFQDISFFSYTKKELTIETLIASNFYHIHTLTPAFNLHHFFFTYPSLTIRTSFLRNSLKTLSRICLVLTP